MKSLSILRLPVNAYRIVLADLKFLYAIHNMYTGTRTVYIVSSTFLARGKKLRNIIVVIISSVSSPTCYVFIYHNKRLGWKLTTKLLKARARWVPRNNGPRRDVSVTRATECAPVAFVISPSRPRATTIMVRAYVYYIRIISSRPYIYRVLKTYGNTWHIICSALQVSVVNGHTPHILQ